MKTSSERRRARRRVQSRVDVVLTVAIVITIAFVMWAQWPPPPPPPISLPPEPLALDGAPTKGSPTASVLLIEYSDFECQHCGAFARETLPAIDAEYVERGKVRLAYRHVAPPNHPRALPAAVAAECARRQGKFWEMHDRLFADQTKLDDASLAAHAGALGLDLVAFTACQADPAMSEGIALDTAQARRLRIPGTPGFFIGRVESDGRVRVTRSLRGAVPLAKMRQALDAELADTSIVAGLAGLTAGVAGLAALIVWVRRRQVRTPSDVG